MSLTGLAFSLVIIWNGQSLTVEKDLPKVVCTATVAILKAAQVRAYCRVDGIWV